MTYDMQHNERHNEGAAAGLIEAGAGAVGAGAALTGGAGGVARIGGGFVEQTGAASAELFAKEYPEPMVARVVGLRRGQLKALRAEHLAKDVDWGLVNSVVCYSGPGVKKLLSAAGLDAGDFRWPVPPGVPGLGAAEMGGTVEAGDPTDGAPEVVAETVEEVVTAGPRLLQLVVRRLCRNPTIVYAEGPEGAEVTVRVRTNENFLAGMAVPAREPTTPGGIWHMEGPCPRWKGRY